MDDAALKREYLEYWHLTPGTPEAEKAWEEKLAMMAGKRHFNAPMIFVQGDICYDSPVDGRHITNLQARQEDLARTGCIPYDPEMKTDAQRRLKEGEDRLDRQVDETVDRMIANLPARKMEKLAAEMEGGLTAEPIRITPPQTSRIS